MPKLSRKGDKDSGGGAIVRGARTVFANGIAVGLHVSPITGHGPGVHAGPSTTDGSPTVICEGDPVLRITSGNTCGHPIAEGSPNIYCP
jgi:uncharacterized Zn-binding protein involved in type VI secretion